MLRQAPRLTLLLLAVPVAAGALGTLAPSFGIKGLSGDLDLNAFHSLINWPGLREASRLSLVTGLASTLIALILSLGLVAALLGTRAFAFVQHLLSPLLAVPHAAAALGLAFLIAPSGWIVRALSPWATGWTAPPDLLILNDPAGIALILGLVAKEMPFLLLMSLAALPQTDAARRMMLATALGYGRMTGFALTVLPALYRQLRLPVFAVLAYAMTTVEMAMILGPTLPPTLSVQIVNWMTGPSLMHRDTAAAAALLQLALVIAALGLWHLAERILHRFLCFCAQTGRRGLGLDRWLRPVTVALSVAIGAALFAGLAGIALWSIAGLWQFPDALPDTISLATWTRALPDLVHSSLTTLSLAALSTLAALALVLACLEAEHRYGLTPGQRALWLLYLPLIVPQVAFLPGLQALSLRGGATGGLAPVAAAHLVFVLPYVFLSLSAPYRAWDSRIATIGAALGASPGRIFWQLRAPLLLAPILTAAAVGMAVSVGQYLPTLLIGGGRVETLTTEAVALSSGGNRRLIGTYALLQLALPALGFALALALPRLVYRNRKGVGLA